MCTELPRRPGRPWRPSHLCAAPALAQSYLWWETGLKAQPLQKRQDLHLHIYRDTLSLRADSAHFSHAIEDHVCLLWCT